MTRTILIVEDNDNIRLLLRDILTYHRFTVLEANNGTDGIRMVRECNPDLVLMDIQMPVMDGITAGTVLKNDPVTSHVKVIAITSLAMKGDREKILAAGFDDYIAKPINTRQLPLIVNRHLMEELPEGTPAE